MHTLHGQMVLTPSATACSCDGAISFSTPVNSIFTLRSVSNVVVSNQANINNFSVNNLCPGSYTLQVESAGVISVELIDIAINASPTPTWGNVIICSNSLNLDLSNALNPLPPIGSWFNPLGVMTAAIEPMPQVQEGAYWYEYNIGGCPVSTGVMVEISDAPNTGNQTTTLICDTWAPFNMLIFMQGAPDPGGNWFTAQGIPMTGIFDPATMNSQLFTYVIDDVPGCPLTYTTMYIQENTTPNPGDSTEILACTNGSPFSMYAQLQGNPSAGGTWTNPNNSTVSNTFTPGVSMPGVYTYRVDALTPCIDQEVTLTIALTASDPSGISANMSICSNTPAFDLLTTLDGNPVQGGTWFNSTGAVISSTFSAASPGPGTYTYYYPNIGCAPQGANVTIAVENLGEAGNNYTGTICESVGSLNLNALRSPNSTNNGTWLDASNAAINPILTLSESAEQTYVYFINGTVCPDDQAAFTIIVDESPSPILDQTAFFCATQGTIDLLTYYGNNPDIYFETSSGTPISNWIDPALTNLASVSVILPSGNICADAEANLTLIIESPISLVPNSATLCENNVNINFDELIPEYAGIQGQWYNQNNLAIANFGSWTPDQTSFYFVPTSLIACPIDTGHLEILVSPFQESELALSQQICALNPGVELMNQLPMGWSLNGEWFINQSPITNTNLDPSVAANGNYNYVVQGQGACPEVIYTLPLVFVDPPNYDLGNDLTFCTNQDEVILGTQNPTYFFNWTPALYLDNATTSAPVLAPELDTTQITILSYTAEISNGICTIFDDIQITFYPNPILPIDDAYSICLGESISIALPALQQYQWLPSSIFPNPTSNIQSIQPISDAQLTVEASNAFGCTLSHTFQVFVHPNPTFEVLSNPQMACFEIRDTLTALGLEPYNYEWSIGNNTWQGDEVNLHLTDPGNYAWNVIAIDEEGCQTTLDSDADYQVYPHPTAIFSVEPENLTTIRNTSQMVNMTTDATDFQWSTSFGYSSFEYSPTIIFPNNIPNRFEVCLIATNAQGCADSTCRNIQMENDYLFWAPNCFTPDGDQINDVFAVQLNGFDPSTFKMSIFDRWGIQVFFTQNWQEPWIGDMQGGTHFAPNDTYQWIVEVKDQDKAEYKTFKGHLVLVR